MKAERGPCYYDATHVLTSYATYDLPIGRDRKFGKSMNKAVNAVVGGWQVNGVLQISSGAPIDFGGNSAILNAPGNNNTLNWIGPGPIPVL